MGSIVTRVDEFSIRMRRGLSTLVIIIIIIIMIVMPLSFKGCETE
jgi:hypothetical protein